MPMPTPSGNPDGAPARTPRRAGSALGRGRSAFVRHWSHPCLKWPKRVAAGTTVLLVIPSVTAGVSLRMQYAGDPAPGTHTRERDAVWLGHAWVDGRNGEGRLAELVQRVRGTGIRDVYVHAGPLEHDGSLPASRYPKARWLVDAVRRDLPGVRVQAWLGDVLSTEGQTGMDLGERATRERVVRSARQVLDAGFAGVHFDLEPLHSGDRDYLSLLDAVRTVTRAHRAPLSVAAHQIDPLPSLHSVAGFVAGHPKWWTQSYFGAVARRVDQIAVMSYDTALPLESLYGGYVARQTRLALEATPRDTDLLMGLPAFHTDDIGHHESAETVAAAVRGVRLGLSREDARRERFGVALYVDFAATPGDWAAYQRGWGAPGSD
ncbi:glycoside hydrolase family 18 protein [Streptomyces yatensis]|uniref:Glycoside hydrolase family 18 protein n=2 Tax=Streptomyces yatensis TaxID=155177 RepID=A0ABP4VFE4_9ACTN